MDGLATRPLLALACNYFCDHAGGLYDFPERACHQLDADRIARPAIQSHTTIGVTQEMFNAVPDGEYDIGAYRMHHCDPTAVLTNGDVIDLGNRQFQVLHIPGVSPGSIVLWEERTGSLFTSDTLYDDPMVEREFYAESPLTYSQNVDRLRSLPVRTVYGGHFRPFGRTRMLEIIDRIQRRGAAHLYPVPASPPQH